MPSKSLVALTSNEIHIGYYYIKKLRVI